MTEPARCQHCYADIQRRPGQWWWEDAKGWTTCVKAAQIGDFVGHTPLRCATPKEEQR